LAQSLKLKAKILNRTTKIPVTIITGFLGAGKTTFINNLLKKYPNTQFALVENEFGDVAIDTKLIKGVDASRMFELKQGCICCTISDEYELVLQELAERFPNVEHMLIETTGVADPAPVIGPFFADEDLKNIYKYIGTICLVDALNFEDSPEKDITIKQVVVADLILISKAEKLSGNQKEEVSKTLQKLNPFAEIKFSEKSVSKNIELNSFLHQNKTEFDFVSISQPHSKLETQTQFYNQPINKDEFIRWLSYTLDIHKNKIYRIKGILCFENEPYEFILQGVGGSFEITEGESLKSSPKSKLVIIGSELPKIHF